ncbi:hypothetical protein E4U21_007226 [Claviceps maximensis]|nr:hypothetical protein E4U21_007226 [Claviceps maximensis]
MSPASLTSLPNDLLLDVIEHLDTSRDVSRLGRAGRRTHQLVEQHGWRAFVKTRFPSFGGDAGAGLSWRDMADRYTYLDRCWETRAVRFDLFSVAGRAACGGRGGGGGGGGAPLRQAVGFHGVVDARYAADGDQEVVAWGAGEDLYVRWAAVSGSSRRDNGCDGGGRHDGGRRGRGERWASILGRCGNYAAGAGDVTALKLLDGAGHGDACAWGTRIVVGRANGDVQLLHAHIEHDSRSGQQVGNWINS